MNTLHAISSLLLAKVLCPPGMWSFCLRFLFDWPLDEGGSDPGGLSPATGSFCAREREKGIAEVFAVSSALLSYNRFPPRPRSSSCSTYCQVSLSRVLALPHRRAVTCYSHVSAATSHHGVEPWPHNTPLEGPPPPPPSLSWFPPPSFLSILKCLFHILTKLNRPTYPPKSLFTPFHPSVPFWISTSLAACSIHHLMLQIIKDMDLYIDASTWV